MFFQRTLESTTASKFASHTHKRGEMKEGFPCYSETSFVKQLGPGAFPY